MKAYVLVGISRRLPGKHLMEVAPGKRLIDKVVENLLSLGLDVEVYSKIPLELDVPVIEDRTSWIVESILSLFRRDDYFFVFGGDMPLVRREAVEQLLNNPKGESVVPRWEQTGYLEPLHALYSADIEPCLRGARSLTTALRKCPGVRFVRAEDMPPETFFNVNTREELERLRALIASSGEGKY